MNRLGATLALVIAIAVVIAIVLGTRSPSASGNHGSHNQASGSTTVQRRDLVQTDTESGTLSYADPQTVYDRLSGTITWLPAVGQVIKPGQALYDVAGVPVILMNGTTPAYRDLKSSDSDGPDILELNRNLVALGFNADGIVVDDVWQAATTDGVELFQESLGESETGDLKLGQIVFLPHNRVISTVDASLGSDGSGSGSGSATAGRPATGPEFVTLTQTVPGTVGATPAPGKPHKKKRKKKKAPTVATLLALLRAQSAQLQAQSAELKAAESAAQGGKNSSGSGGGSKSGGGSNSNKSGGSGGSGGSSGSGGTGGSGGSGGGSGGGGSPVLETNSTQLVVTVDLDATKQREAKVGEPVTVEMPAGNTVSGKVTAVSPVAQSSSNSGNGNSGSGGSGGGGGGSGNGNGSSGATIPVTVALRGRTTGAGFDQAAVSVSFAQAEAKGVLSVPVTALLAVSGGQYAVQEAAAPHTLIPVTTGLFAAGYVQISGQGISPGLAVTDSQG